MSGFYTSSAMNEPVAPSGLIYRHLTAAVAGIGAADHRQHHRASDRVVRQRSERCPLPGCWDEPVPGLSPKAKRYDEEDARRDAQMLSRGLRAPGGADATSTRTPSSSLSTGHRRSKRRPQGDRRDAPRPSATYPAGDQLRSRPPLALSDGRNPPSVAFKPASTGRPKRFQDSAVVATWCRHRGVIRTWPSTLGGRPSDRATVHATPGTPRFAASGSASSPSCRTHLA